MSHLFPTDAEMALTCYGGTHNGVTALWRPSEFSRTGDFGRPYVELFGVKGAVERYYLTELECRHTRADLRIRFKMLISDAVLNEPWPATEQMKWASDALASELDKALPPSHGEWDIYIEAERTPR